MTDIIKTVSHAIESQFPDIYKSEGQELIAFVKAYYEFLETTDKYSVKVNRAMFESNDIDDSLDEFLVHFKEKYLADFPFVTATDKRFMIKHIIDLYSAKGSKNSLELLMRMLFNEESDIYYPGEDILKVSDSKWTRPIYIEVTKSARNRTFLNKQITGNSSGAKAFVEGVVTKRVDGKLIDVMYLSSLRGNFSTGERVSDDGVIKNSPTIIGSLTTLDVELGGRNNTVGDIFDVVNVQGKQGKVRVTATEDATGKVDFNLIDGGYGYTNSTGNTATSVYISDAVLEINNPNLDFIRFEPVIQRIETLELSSATDVNASVAIGDYLEGRNSSGAVANGVVVSIANTGIGNTVITEPSANSLISVQVLNDSTFGYQNKIELTSAGGYIVNEYLEEENSVTLSIANPTGTFTVGQRADQKVYETVIVAQYDENGDVTGVTTTTDVLISHAFGTVVASNSTVVELDKSWGVFTTEASLYLRSNPSVNSEITSVEVTSQGARAIITAVQDGGANVVVRDVFGVFTATKKVRGNTTRIQREILDVDETGATDVWLNGVSTDNGTIDSIANNFASGIIIGQNTTSVGIYGNTSPFFKNDEGTTYIETQRELLISPPRHANGSILELSVSIANTYTGVSAGFDIGFLENTETLYLNTDLVGGNNVSNVAYTAIALDGSNSSIGFVAALDVVDGGTLYSNGQVVDFTGGGFAGGDPIEPAVGIVETDGSGTITSITIDVPGEGYYEAPTFEINGGTSGTAADLTLVMNYGYGFPKSPQGDADSLIIDLLTDEEFTIGSIASITRINPGANYNVNPYVLVYNNYIASYHRTNIYVYLSSVSGSFKVGELLEQIIDLTTTAKGKVISYELTGAGIGTLYVERNAFNVSFQPEYPITGSESGATGFVELVLSDEDASNVLGDNAVVTGTVIAANGIATAVEVIDSGYGYADGSVVTLERDGFPYIITANTHATTQGIGEGFWETTSSHLNSEKKIHDNYYYQEYSYDVQCKLALNKYENIVRKVLHVAGNELFGTVVLKNSVDSSISIANSSIEVV